MERFNKAVEKYKETTTLYYSLEPLLGSDVALATIDQDLDDAINEVKVIASEIILNKKNEYFVDMDGLIDFITASQALPF